MKEVFQAICLFFAVGVMVTQCTPPSPEAQPLRIMTYNIKYDNPNDSLLSWQQRKRAVNGLINFYAPDFLGTQEALKHQLDDISAANNRLRYVGVGRNGGNEGEFSALFYDSTRFSLESDTTLWLSETPGQPSKSWDAAFPRILSGGRFVENQTGRQFAVFNTHFDHVGDTARAQSARIITQFVESIPTDYSLILTGDFNVTPDALPYQLLTASPRISDSRRQSQSTPIGPEFTFAGFEVNPTITPRRIDYIFTDPAFTILKHAAISSFSGGYYPSDHLSVISDIQLSTK